MPTFEHPLFANIPWRGCTTESLKWEDPNYDLTAGKVGVRLTNQADSSKHLFFVDMVVRTNDGREVVMERIEGGKLLSALYEARDSKASA